MNAPAPLDLNGSWDFRFEEGARLADAARPEISGFAIWQLADSRSYHHAGADVRCKPFAENLAGVYDAFRRLP